MNTERPDNDDTTGTSGDVRGVGDAAKGSAEGLEGGGTGVGADAGTGSTAADAQAGHDRPDDTGHSVSDVDAEQAKATDAAAPEADAPEADADEADADEPEVIDAEVTDAEVGRPEETTAADPALPGAEATHPEHPDPAAPDTD
ncbi:hypothetical protein JHN63_50245, partial [Streptomyces sp. MBT65]|nr:hypothetical protein [Streptomyces sp. MBT65]